MSRNLNQKNEKFKTLISFSFCSFSSARFIWSKIGIRAGLNLSNMEITNEDYDDDYKMRTGYHIGPVVEFSLSDKFSIEGAVLLTTKGYKLSITDTYDGEEYKFREYFNPLYLDIPVTAKGTFEIGNAKVFVAAGPYLGFGIGGDWKSEFEVNGEIDTEEDKIEYGTNKNLKPTDFGATLGVGVEVKDIMVGVSYSLGLLDVSPYSGYDAKIYHRVLAISMGYKFDLSKK